jgi:hypothetical protein
MIQKTTSLERWFETNKMFSGYLALEAFDETETAETKEQ